MYKVTSYTWPCFFWHPGKSDLSIVHVYSGVHWTSHFLQSIRKTRPCLTGHTVGERCDVLRECARGERVVEGSVLGSGTVLWMNAIG